ncbi:MAG: hypothetical protein K6A80_05055 [Saccharofermentans sp.]|nr:hypothetical protein [Saccharofermentans sp.]
MRKLISLILCCAVILTMLGCEDNSASGRPGNQPAGVNDVLESGMASEDNITSVADSRTSAPETTGGSESSQDSTGGIDVDLTVMSSTVVYSEVYSMMISPESYIGKTVKMKGAFVVYHDALTDKYYYACIISDATACCSQGIEFILTDDYTYPDDYPQEGGEICVAGVFDTYQENGRYYCTLRDARIV